MKIATVVGARPQFIKAAVVSQELRANHDEIIIHTGQHYDYNMSGQFFEELDIPFPRYNLGISGGSHSQMTGRMMISIEDVLVKEKPDCVLVYGDTNSTLAASLAAAKLHIPICHVESGNRTHSKTNPEEINRVCTDHLSTLLLACTESGLNNLKHEGLADSSYLVGDPMYDAFIKYSGCIPKNFFLELLTGEETEIPEEFYYLTCHREENTNNDSNLLEILKAMDSLDSTTVYPVHPRNKERALRLLSKYNLKNILLVQPIGYLESIYLVNHAKKIVTDSGGLQREAFFANKKCVTILDFECWPETMVSNRNTLCKPKMDNILKALNEMQVINNNYTPFGDGHASVKIVKCIEDYFK